MAEVYPELQKRWEAEKENLGKVLKNTELKYYDQGYLLKRKRKIEKKLVILISLQETLSLL
ncbi:hypothetical protein P7H17_23720 [Paenibacillus larvae]|nr:hypothetical protein [Paenibacillus larvae]MDT2288451.1 hypothetical protein [Paenibacillus larvae]